MKDLYLILKNLTRKPLRLFLTVFATFIAFMIFGTLTAFQQAFDAGVDLAADDRLVVVNKINFTQTLPIAYANRVRGVEDVVAVTHLNWFGGYYQEPRNQFAMFAVDAENFLTVYDELVIGDAERAAWIANRQGLIAGKSIAENFGWQAGERIPVNSNIFSQRDGRTDWDFDVVAIYEGADPQTDTNSVYFHYEYFNETQSFGGVLGVLAAGLMVSLVNKAPIQLPVLVLGGSVWTQALLYVAVLGFITGIVPAMNALKLNIITALSRS